MESLYDKLIDLKNRDLYPMHMPGHKRNTTICSMENPYAIDITEIPGFDNLHQPEGILLSLSQRISHLYGSGRAFPLVNGSTAGILAAISAAVNRGDKVLLMRNAHKSVYHAVILMGLVPVYFYPQKVEGTTLYGGILPENIEEVLIKDQEIKLVIITSPTYGGVVSDVRAIAELAHKHGALLLVDEAHGAHFGFHEGFPESAVTLGADLVIQSLHKTLPALTQTAVLHSNNNRLNNRIEKYLAVYESSSPSYLLLASIENCIRMLEEKAEELFDSYDKRLNRFYQSMNRLKHLKLMTQEDVGRHGIYALDRSKITIYDRDRRMTGHQLQEILYRDYHVVLEMEAPEYVLGMTSICDTEEGIDRLERALLELDGTLDSGWVASEAYTQASARDREINRRIVFDTSFVPEQAMLPAMAWNMPVEQLEFNDSAGRISATFLCLFPPGAPVLVPGEVIDRRMIEYIEQVKQEGITITGFTGEDKNRIDVVLQRNGD